MHVRTCLSCTGARFSPQVIEARIGFKWTVAHEPGAMGGMGRYLGRPIPFGSAELISSYDSEMLAVPDQEFFRKAEAIIRVGKEMGIEECILRMDVEFQGQCNLELGPHFVSEVQRLGVPLALTCYESREEDRSGA